MKRIDFIRNGALATAGVFFAPSLLKAQKNLVEAEIAAPVNAKGKGLPFDHFWSRCVGAGRANEGLRASWQDQLKLVKENCGFQYCRFHGIFHDDMFILREVNGEVFYNWQYLDDLFDRMLAIGVKPFVELAFMPKPLASTDKTQFWWKGNVAPPIDFGKWAELIVNFTNHCISRYGIAEVCTWYFEVWNEPDLAAFWDGTKSQYFELYKYSVNAIKAINKNLRVGGPATSNFVPDGRFDGEHEDKTKQKTLTVADINTLDWHGTWIKDFIAYCSSENLPVDFISTHPYPTDWALDPETKKGAGRVRKMGATKEDLLWLKKTIAESAYPNAEVHCTEWSSSPSSRDPTHDSLQAAAYILRANLDCIGLAKSLSYWTFTDIFEEGGAGNSIFHGGFGIVNYQGIVKPAFHAYRMLNALGDEILQQQDGIFVSRHFKTGNITALVYHYPPELTNVISGDNCAKEALTGSPKLFSLQIDGLRPGSMVNIEKLDKNNGFAYSKWQAMGCPEPPTVSQTQELKTAAFATKKQKFRVGHSGQYLFKAILQPWNCVMINIART